jgi:CheY-like chemotaxis protein
MKKIIIARNLLKDLEENNTIFSRSSITLFPALSSEEIINLHGVKKADLIITDAALPLMGGARLCARIRSDAELKYVSIILICDDDGNNVSQCQEAGANVVLRRPLEPGMLLWRTSELLVIPQRKDMRVLLRVSVTGNEGNTPFFGLSLNIGLSGMLFETDRVLKRGDQLTCAFNIAHSEITLACRVERVEPTPSKRNRYGVRFMNCDTRSLIIIENFVKAPKGVGDNDAVDLP